MVTNDEFESTEWVTDIAIDQSDRIVATVTGFRNWPVLRVPVWLQSDFPLHSDGRLPTPRLPHRTELWELGANAVRLTDSTDTS